MRCTLWRSVAAVALLCALVGIAHPQAQIQRPVQLEARPTLQHIQLTPIQLSQRFEAILKEQGVVGELNEGAVEKFRALPTDLQSNIIMTLDRDYATIWHRDDLVISRIRPEILDRIRELRLFAIGSIWPNQGSPGGWSYAFGRGFNSDCVVVFDGTPVESHYLGMHIEFFPNSMAFKVPTNASRAQQHDVMVRNTTNGDETAVVRYEIIAPRGYRGYNGWRFSNFSRATIDWKLYRHYFGALTVEYANGTRRPAAEAWYNSAYKSAGAGGNCYGMSVSSLRVRNNQYDHMFHAGHFQNAPTAQSSVWLYEWNDTTRETVQQQQGAWYTQEVLDVYVNLRNNQTPRDVFNRAQSLVLDWVNRPVLVYWAPTWGHAVVPYSTQVDGNTRRIICYDNNNPYRENETGAIDPDIATVDWAANTFSRGSATTAQLFSYEECTPSNPHLPGAEYGGPGQNTVVAVLSHSAKVQQITDEAGRRFFNPDGTINEDPGSRIPMSAYMPPLVQQMPQPRVITRPQLGQVQQLAGLQPPPDAPHVFVFGEASGKSLTFNVAGEGAKQLDLFSHGRIFRLESTGVGEVRFNNLLQLPTMQLLNAQSIAPTGVQFIRSTTQGDRAFLLNNLRNLGTQELQLLPNAQGTELEVIGPPNLQFNLNLLGPVGQGMQGADFANIGLQAGAKVNVAPLNWGALQTSELRMQQLNLQNNAVIQQQTIQGIR